MATVVKLWDQEVGGRVGTEGLLSCRSAYPTPAARLEDRQHVGNFSGHGVAAKWISSLLREQDNRASTGE